MSERTAGEPIIGDAFGQALLDYLVHGSDGREHFIERDDGLLEMFDTGVFFTAKSDWSAIEAAVTERSGSRVLDIGAGAGRHALPLQDTGRNVVALDVSAGAIEVCQRRGVLETFTGTVFEYAETNTKPFDTFLLCGNNYGLLESPQHAPKFLSGLTRMAAPGAEIIGTCMDPYSTTDPLHLAYHEFNRSRARLPGQIRLRSRWANLASPWFDYLFLPVRELEELAETAGWELVTQESGPGSYVAILRLR
jgi:SAM-dependent methyltransferase